MNTLKLYPSLVTALLALIVASNATTAVAAVAPVTAKVVSPRIPDVVYRRLVERIDGQGKARVIVQVTSPGLTGAVAAARGDRSPTARTALRFAIDKAQARVERTMAFDRGRVLRRFARVPFIAVEVDQQALDDLLQHPDVASVEEDRVHFPVLASSSGVVGANELAAQGFTGSGTAVAVLDSGVDKAHAFLSGAVISEACFSTTYSPHNATSLCPDGTDEQFGEGAGVNCSTAVPGCDHGTHVAGIAAGNGATGGVAYSGMGRDANVIAVQVFSEFDDGAGPYIAAYTSDIVAGLSYVLDLHEDPGFTTNIVAANLSLGGGVYTSSDACDGSNPSTKAIIDQLRDAGIATVIAAGNGGDSEGLASPGCISSAVSVGATLDSDAVASFSNSASWLSVFAPGVSITSSVPGGKYGGKSGTSMAAPHVTGALASMHSAAEGLRPGLAPSLDEILAALSNKGVPVTDTRSGFTVPRIQLDAAADAFDECLAPAANVVLDNAYVDAVASTLSGAFITLSGSSHYRGKALRTATAGVDAFRFTPALQSAGDYRISAWWGADAANSPQATFSIRHKNGVDDIVVDQRVGGGRWAELGVFRLSADGSDHVTVSDVNDPGGTLLVDAVRFEFLQTPTLMSIDTAMLPEGVRGKPYDVTVSAGCAVSPATWSLVPGGGSLPSGLILDPASGRIHGTPATVGANSFSLRVDDASGGTATRAYLLVINEGTGTGGDPLTVATTALPDGTVGAAYIETLGASGGTAPYSWSLSGGTLPAGLTLASDGTLDGTPSLSGSFGFTVQVTDNAGASATQPLTLSIAEPGSAVFFDDFEDGTLSPWNQLGAGRVRVVSDPTDGWLLRKDSNNDPNGGWAPLGTAVGDFELVVYTRKFDSAGGSANRYGLTDGAGNGYGAYLTSSTGQLVLVRRTGWSPSKLGTPDAVAGGVQLDQWYTLRLRLQGGVVSATAYAGRVDPAGATPIAEVSSTDTTYSSFNRVNVSGGYTFDTDDVRVVALSADPGPVIIATTALPDGTVGAAYSETLGASGGTAPYSWSLSGGTLPAGLTLASDGTLDGTPSLSGSFGFTVQVTDNAGASATQPLTLSIAEPGSAVFFDDFEDGTLSPWNQLGAGRVRVVSDPTDGWLLRKDSNNDPNGGWAPLGTAVGDFELVVYTRKFDSAGGSANRYGLTDGAGNGYGAYLTSSTGQLVLVRRTGWSPSKLGTPDAVAGGVQLDQWYTLRLRLQGGVVSATAYAGRVDPAGATPIAEVSSTDTTYSSFSRVNVSGGYTFDTDDVRVSN